MRVPSFVSHLSVIAVAACAAAMPLPAFAQDTDADFLPPRDSAAAELTDRLGDPATQQAMAKTLATMSEVLLDIPLAPLAEAGAKMAGEDPAMVDRDMTLRKLAGPDAARVPGEIAEKLPEIMSAAAGMAEGFERMLPILTAMAGQLKENLAAAMPPED